MHTGRNNGKKKRIATVSFLLLVGAGLLAAAPAGAVSLLGEAAGQADAVWGAAGGLAGDEDASAQGDMGGSASAAARAIAGVEATPPDPQPHVDEAAALAAEAKALAEAKAAALLAQKGNLAGGAGAKWGLAGSGDGSYDVMLGGAYDAGLRGTLLAHSEKDLKHKVDVRGANGATAQATGRVEGAVNGLLEQVEGLWGKLRMSVDLGLDSAAQAIGSVGMDIAGIFGFQTEKVVDASALDRLHLHQDIAAPALPKARLDIPDLRVPSVAVDQGGQVAADAAATATGAVRS